MFDNGSCYWWKIQTWEEDWGWLIWRALLGYVCTLFIVLVELRGLFALNVNSVFYAFVFSGVNVQTGEEVAVKLVSAVTDFC